MKVLIASVSTGSGHLRAAEAVQAALQITQPAVRAHHVNAMHYVTRPFRRLYEDGYALVANRAPFMWSSIYKLMDRRASDAKTIRWINTLQSWNARAFTDCIERYAPDLILTTHFFIPQILSSSAFFKRARIPLECVITDFDYHHSWLESSVSHYYVARAEVADKLHRNGVATEAITVSGIPIDPSFSIETERRIILERLGLRADVPTLLVLSGGLGFGAMEKTVRQLFRLPGPLQVITVSGKNAQKLAALKKLDTPPHVCAAHLGFATNMHELVGAADVVITKAGGLTVSECLAKGAGLVIFHPIPGQEEKNTAFVVGKNAGLKAINRGDLLEKVGGLLTHPETLHAMRMNARALGKPEAAFTIAANVLKHLA